jgi:antitoxin (DNA-binding transcriptional repressor) of toxin-antitoxin stability system
MLETISFEEAQSSLPSLIERLMPGAEIVITRNDQPVATLHSSGNNSLPQPRFGSCQGSLTIITEDAAG